MRPLVAGTSANVRKRHHRLFYLRPLWHQRHGKRKMNNPFEEITAKLDALAVDVRALKSRTNEKPADEVGGLELAVKITGLARRTIYKRTHRREIPHRRVGGRLYFKRSELLAWLEAGKRPMASEVAEERMAGNK